MLQITLVLLLSFTRIFSLATSWSFLQDVWLREQVSGLSGL